MIKKTPKLGKKILVIKVREVAIENWVFLEYCLRFFKLQEFENFASQRHCVRRAILLVNLKLSVLNSTSIAT
jgi:hypothetical protein